MWNYLLFSENESQLDRLKRNQYNFNIILKFFVDHEDIDIQLRKKELYLYKQNFLKRDSSKINYALEKRFFLTFIHPYINWRRVKIDSKDQVYQLWYFNGLSYLILNDYFIKICSLFWKDYWIHISEIDYNHRHVFLRKKFFILWNFIYNFKNFTEKEHVTQEDMNYLIQRYDSYFYEIYSIFSYFDKKYHEYENITHEKEIIVSLYTMLVEYKTYWFKSFFEDFKNKYTSFQTLENTKNYTKRNIFEDTVNWSFSNEKNLMNQKMLLRSKNNFLEEKRKTNNKYFLSLFWLLWKQSIRERIEENQRWNEYMFDINEYHQYLKEILDHFESFNFDISEENILSLFWCSYQFNFDKIFDLKTLNVENIKKSSEYHEQIVSKIFEKHNNKIKTYFSLDVLKWYTDAIVHAHRKPNLLGKIVRWKWKEYEMDMILDYAFDRWLTIFCQNKHTYYSWKFQYLLSYLFELFFSIQDFLVLVKCLLVLNNNDINKYLKIKFTSLDDFSFFEHFKMMTSEIIKYFSHKDFDFDQKEEYTLILTYLKNRITSLTKEIYSNLIWKNWSNL